MNAQAQLLTAGMIEESRVELEKTHISVGDLFAIFDTEGARANRLHAGKEVRVKGRKVVRGDGSRRKSSITSAVLLRCPTLNSQPKHRPATVAPDFGNSPFPVVEFQN